MFLPLLEHVEFDESKCCETLNGEQKIMQVKTDEKSTSRFVCTVQFPRKALDFKFLKKTPHVKFRRLAPWIRFL